MSSSHPARVLALLVVALVAAFAVTNTVRAQTYQVGGVNRAGQPVPAGSGAFTVPPPTLDPHTTLIRGDSLLITGRAQDAFQVEVSGPNGLINVPVLNEQFSATLPVGSLLGANRVNPLYFTAIAPTFDLQRSAPATTHVTHDQAPPTVFIDFPPAGAQITTPEVDVMGRVGDLLSGYSGLSVLVNGQAAAVSVGTGNNGTFVRLAVPLSLGRNVIEAIATDALTNSAITSLQVTRIDIPAGSPTMQVISGNAQSAMVGAELAEPIRVRVLRGDGSPFAGKVVTFHVTRNDGRLATAPGASSGSLLFQAIADGSGYAQAWWKLGGTAGQGNNRVEVTSQDVLGSVFFCASGTPGMADQINVGSGNNQRVEVGAVAPEPLRVWVSDSCNGAAGIPVTFSVIQGGGLVNGGSHVTVTTSVTGHTQVALSLGPLPGANVIEASFPANPGAPAVFLAYGLFRDPAQPTSFRGVVLDNAGQPLQNAVCQLNTPGQSFVRLSATDGGFHFDDIPSSGSVDLFVHGVSVTAVGGRPVPTGSFPSLHFEPILVANAENSLGMPVLLPPLRLENRRFYSTSQPTELTVQGIDGLRMIVAPGSMRMPDGSLAPDGTIVALNQVHHDDIPMPMPDGAAPPFAWTLQPGGATFDPPIRIEYPNMSALPPGALAYFLSFDHDTGRFEIVSSARVTDDGLTIVSDPGGGLSVAGWGCNCPPYSVTTDCEPCETTCEDAGSISCSGGVSVSDATPDHMQPITFTAAGCSDSGGSTRTECPDGSVSFDTVGAAGVSYSWSVTKPTGAVLTGSGPSAALVADECGTYMATFRARADRTCPPSEVVVGTATAVVTGDLEDPKSLPSLEIDLNAICEFLDFLRDIAARYEAGPCDVSGCPDLSVSVEREQFQQCCADGVRNLVRWSGNLSGSLGSGSCTFFVYGIPYVARINVTLTASASVSLSISTQETCEEPELCFSPSIDAGLTGEVSGSIGPGGSIGSLAVGLSINGITAEAEYCTLSGVSAEICIGEISVIGSVQLLAGLITVDVNTPIVNGYCYSTP